MPDQALINTILGSAGAGTAIMVVLFLLGLVNTKHAMDEVKSERDRANARAEKAEARAEQIEEQLNSALKFTAERTAPMLESFVSATNTLIPILQGVVRYGLPRAGQENDR